ncbi:unnamed protein product [Urochloa decumbens]|uniref:Uncharacterized protein n=1 Tax=Urochloa decumbens TaxID=240449 RepID=A0ABC9DUB1_9POAL
MDPRHAARTGTAWLIGAGLLVLTLSSGAALCRAAGDTASVAFIVTSYVTLLLLFACLRAYERAPAAGAAGGRSRDRLRRAVWALSTLLTVMFAWRVVAVMPYWPAALVVWVLAALTAVGGFVALFHRRGP